MPSKSKPAAITPYSTPRERFVKSPSNIKAHQDLVDSEAFDKGTDAAIVDLCLEWGKNVRDMNSAAEAGFMLKGAEAYLRRLKTFAETSPPPTQPEPIGALIQTDPQRRV